MTWATVCVMRVTCGVWWWWWCDVQLSALGKKKKAADNERIAVLENARKQHNYHIGRLEQMLRLLDNNDLAPDQVLPLYEKGRCTPAVGVTYLDHIS